ncbi:Preprotein translocase subunit SECE1 [Bienertia sinuspersici]
MAITLSRSLHFPINSRHSSSKLSQSQLPQNLSLPPIKFLLHLSNHTKHPLSKTQFILKATENESENPTKTEQQQSSEEQLSELGTEIKKAMKEKEKAEDSGGFLRGVIDEIGKIEWPEFRKVIGTTGVVLGVIAGSSVVLLTVNAVLAELSDSVFAGKGVQDFFGG